MPGTPLRKVRSFVRRPGRITAAQRRALETLGPRYVLELAARELDWRAAFGRDAPHVLDIGFGDGEALLTSALAAPEADFLGVEVHEPGVGHLLLMLERADVGNVRVVIRDVVEVLEQMIGPGSLDVVNLFFPDPWPKKRHHKRRLVQPDFVARLAGALRRGGLLHLATDWDDYAEHIVEVLASSPDFERLDGAPHGALARRAPSKFERRGQARGHRVHELYYRRS